MSEQRERFNLLLVEDNPGDALLVREMLEETSTKSAVQVAGRLESGELPLNKEPLDLRYLLADTTSSLENFAATKGVTLHYSAPETAVTVNGDCKWLGEVLVNLLTNAVKFSSPQRPVYVLCRVNGSVATVAVRDESEGIAEEDLARIFDRFYQAKSAAKNAGVGSGLGLYIARGIVEAHDGTMRVKSKKGKGSTFFFTLPLHRDGYD